MGASAATRRDDPRYSGPGVSPVFARDLRSANRPLYSWQELERRPSPAGNCWHSPSHRLRHQLRRTSRRRSCGSRACDHFRSGTRARCCSASGRAARRHRRMRFSAAAWTSFIRKKIADSPNWWKKKARLSRNFLLARRHRRRIFRFEIELLPECRWGWSWSKPRNIRDR